MASSILSAGINILVGALQDCPVLFMQWNIPLDTAFAKSTSSKIILADFPPNSCVTLFTVSAEFLATETPALVDPVKDIISIPRCLLILTPNSLPFPLIKLKIPSGSLASSIISAKMIALNGASSLGLSIIVHPAANAGATLQAIWLSGQFHGVIKPQTPTGSFCTIEEFTSFSKLKFAKIFLACIKWPRPDGTCAFSDNVLGAPISIVTALDKSFILFLYDDIILSKIFNLSSLEDLL